MKYTDYLKTDHWKERRAQFKKRTKSRCYICKTRSEQLHVHHKRYSDEHGSILFREAHTDLRLLCATCHNKLHKYHLEYGLSGNKMKRRALRDFIKTLK